MISVIIHRYRSEIPDPYKAALFYIVSVVNQQAQIWVFIALPTSYMEINTNKMWISSVYICESFVSVEGCTENDSSN